MCFPGPLGALGLGLSAIGSVVNARQQQANLDRQARAREAALREELDRQDAMAAQTAEIFRDTSRDMRQPKQEQRLQEATQRRQQFLQAQMPDADTESVPISGSAPRVVQTEIARQLSDAVANARNQAAALGRLGARDDLNFGNAIALNRAGGRVNEIGGFAGESAALNQREQEAAYNNAYRAPGMLGDLLGIGGTVAGMAGNMGRGPQWGDLRFWGGRPPVANMGRSNPLAV